MKFYGLVCDEEIESYTKSQNSEGVDTQEDFRLQPYQHFNPCEVAHFR